MGMSLARFRVLVAQHTYLINVQQIQGAHAGFDALHKNRAMIFRVIQTTDHLIECVDLVMPHARRRKTYMDELCYHAKQNPDDIAQSYLTLQGFYDDYDPFDTPRLKMTDDDRAMIDEHIAKYCS